MPLKNKSDRVPHLSFFSIAEIRKEISVDVLCCLADSWREKKEEFLHWLSQDKKRLLVLLFAENEMWDHPQIRYIFKEYHEEHLKEIAWESVFLRLGFIIPDPGNQDAAFSIFSKISYFHQGVTLLSCDYVDLGAQVIKNIVHNILKWPQSKKAEELFQKFKGIPAIICGAGPSLAKNLAILQQLENQALIFAGGSSLNILSQHAIGPHFSAAIDPSPPLARFKEQTAFEAPFFYQNRVSHSLFSSVHGQALWMTDSGSYPLEGWLNEQLELPSATFDGGWNVATFLTALAYHLGCSPIIFMGMDLSTPNEQVYAAGISALPEEKKLTCIINDEGEKLFSKPDWLMAAKWLESFAETKPEVEWINATEGGVGFKGIKRLSLDEVKHQFLQQSQDLKAQVHLVLQNIDANKQPSSLISLALTTLKKSLKRSHEYIEKMLQIYEKCYPQPPFEKGEFVLAELDLEEELFYQKFLQPLWTIWKPVLARETVDAAQLSLHKLLFFKKALHTIYPSFLGTYE